MALQSFTEWLLERPATPGFLKGEWSGRLLGVCGLVFDSLGSAMLSAVASGWPGHPLAATDALAIKARERMLWRYPTDTNETFGQRIIDAWTTWQEAGSKEMLEAELAKYGLTGAYLVACKDWDGTTHRLDYDAEVSGPFLAGESLTIDGGTYTADIVTVTDYGTTGYLRVNNLVGGTPSNDDTILGDTSGATANASADIVAEDRPAFGDSGEYDDGSRFWFYLPVGSHAFTGEDGDWGDPGVWDDGGVWDYEGMSPQDIIDIVTLIEQFRPGHERCVRVRIMTTAGAFTAPDAYSGNSFTLEINP